MPGGHLTPTKPPPQPESDLFFWSVVVLLTSVGIGLFLAAVAGCAPDAKAQDPSALADPALVKALEQVLSGNATAQTTTEGLSALANLALFALLGYRAYNPPTPAAQAPSPNAPDHQSTAALLARIDERTRVMRREQNRIRGYVHWHGNCLQALADKTKLDLPEKPGENDEEDSDDPAGTRRR